MTAFNHTSFGFMGWGLSWLAQAVLFHQSSYFSHSTTVADWGFPHGGRRAFSRIGNDGEDVQWLCQTGPPEGYARSPQGYAGNRPAEGFNRGYQAPEWVTPGLHSKPSTGCSRRSIRRSSTGVLHMAPASTAAGLPHPTGAPQQAYRAPAASFQHNEFAQRSSAAFSGKSFAGYSSKPAHTGGGGHPFGGGHSEKSFGGGVRALKFGGGGKSFVRPLGWRRSSLVRQAPLRVGLHISSYTGAAFPKECRVLFLFAQSTLSANVSLTTVFENDSRRSILQMDGTGGVFWFNHPAPQAATVPVAALRPVLLPSFLPTRSRSTHPLLARRTLNGNSLRRTPPARAQVNRWAASAGEWWTKMETLFSPPG